GTRVVEHARTELPESTVAMWFADVRATGVHGNVLELVAPSDLVRERLQRNHLEMIREVASAALGKPITVHVEIDHAIRTGPMEDVVVVPDPPAHPRPPQPMRDESPGAPGLPVPNDTVAAVVPGPAHPLAHA